MNKSIFKNIFIEGSFLLGWEVLPQQIKIFIEVCLLESHPEFDGIKPNEANCYKLATLAIDQYEKTSGFPIDQMEPEWDSDFSDYKDLEEINSIDLGEDSFRLEADEIKLEITGITSITLEF